MLRKISSVFLLICFFNSTLMPISKVQANELNLPVPGTMVNLSPVFEPALIKGLTVNKDNPFLFDFIVDGGQDHIQGEALKQQADRMIKYFFASLTIPEKDIWVNLSPFEKDRTVPTALGQTVMGRDLLAQDYILKQLTASLIYPEKELGKKFWDGVYSKARQMYGANVNIPVNTFNKVWIVADKARVYEHGQTAWVVDGHMKVMLEEDYLAGKKNNVETQHLASLSKQMLKDLIIPEIEKEVNQGQNFAQLRQIFNSLILANWFKKNIQQALLNQVYADKSTVKGIDSNKPKTNQEIYHQYLKAYKKGVFNYIKEDAKQISSPKKYFSGGFNSAMTIDSAMPTDVQTQRRQFTKFTTNAQRNSAMVMRYDRNEIQLNRDTAMKVELISIKKITFRNEYTLSSDDLDLVDKVTNFNYFIDDFLLQLSQPPSQSDNEQNIRTLYFVDEKTGRYTQFKKRIRDAILSEIIKGKIRQRNSIRWSDYEYIVGVDVFLRRDQNSQEEINNTIIKTRQILLDIRKEVANFIRHVTRTLFNRDSAMSARRIKNREDADYIRGMFEKYQRQGKAMYYAKTRPTKTPTSPKLKFSNNNDVLKSEDSATVTPTGGIDLDVGKMGMDVQKNVEGGVQVTFDPAMIERVRLQGIQSINPVIINTTIITDIRPLLGLAPKREDQGQLAGV